MSQKARATSLENIFVSDTHRIIYTEISYLKRRIHLVEGERKANYESNEETLKKNETNLKEIKEKNVQLKSERKTMIQSKEIFVKEISARLGGEKKAYEFKNKKFAEVVDILECKIGTLRNKQNYLKYSKEQQVALMSKVAEEEEQLHKMMEGNLRPKRTSSNNKTVPPAVKKRLDGIKHTETSTAAMMMKITEADNIRSRYKNMITLLKEENVSLNMQVSENDKKLASDVAEIERIRQVLADSLKAKKVAKTRLTEIEETTIKAYSEREQHLHEARLQLKTIREKMEQIGAKLSFPKFHMIHRDSSVADGGGLYVGYQSADDKREGKGQSIVETVYAELAAMIGESDPSLIVTRFEEQRNHAKELLVQEENVKSVVRKAKLRKRFLDDKLSQLQFSGGLKREKLNTRTSKINKEMSSISMQRDKLNSWREDHILVMEQMLAKLNEICTINEFKVPAHSVSSEIPAENVVSLLKLVLKQLERLLGSGFEFGSSSFSFSPMPPTTPTTLAQKYGNNDDLNTSSEGGGGLIPFEIAAEGPSIFNLPSPVGSTTSFRLGGSISDLDVGIGGGHALGDMSTGSASDILASFRDRAPSILVHDHDRISGGLHVGGGGESSQREDSAGGMKGGKGRGRKDSSEEEEAVTRNFVKRQSQILYEAKTRKGRFTPGGGSAGGGGAISRS